MTGNQENKPARKTAWQRAMNEALSLFVFAWIASLIVSLLRYGPRDSFANFGVFQFVVSTLSTGLEIFVFGYVLSRFFKQFKTGCAVAVILFFGYLIWAGRHPQ